MNVFSSPITKEMLVKMICRGTFMVFTILCGSSGKQSHLLVGDKEGILWRW